MRTDEHCKVRYENWFRRRYANRAVVERKSELPSLADDGSEVFNRSP